MLPESLLDECLRREDNEITIAPWKTTMEDQFLSLGCLYVDCSSSAFIPLSHKGYVLVLGSHMLWVRCQLSISGPYLHSLKFASTIPSRWLPFFNLQQVWMLTKSSEEVSDQTALFKVCFISTIFRCFHASMWF